MSAEELERRSNGVYFITGTLTVTATALGSSTRDLTEMIVQASPSNTVNIVIGDATTQGWVMEPGDVQPFPIRNPALIFGKAASSTATYSLFGRTGA